MSRAAEVVKVTVRFPSGSIITNVPFWASDATIIRDAIDVLPAFLAPRHEDCSVVRKDGK